MKKNIHISDKKYNNNILIVLPSSNSFDNGDNASAFDITSVIYIYAAINQSDQKIDFASPKGGILNLNFNDLKEIKNNGVLSNYFKINKISDKFKNTKKLDDIDPFLYKAVISIGGLTSFKDFSNNNSLQEIIKIVYENNGIIATLDHGVAAIINVKLTNGEFLIKNKKITTFSETEMMTGFRLKNREEIFEIIPYMPDDIIKQNGGLFQEAEQMFESRVIEDQRIISAGLQKPSSLQFANTVSKAIFKQKKKILLVVTSNNKSLSGNPAGLYLPELTDYHYVMSRNDNFEFDIASPKGGKAPIFNESNFLKNKTYQEYLLNTELLLKLYNTIPLSEINPENYVAVHFAGGFAALTDFPYDKNLKKVLQKIYENNGIVSAVCHGSSALLNVKLSSGKYLLEGLKVTSRTIEEETAFGRSTKKQVLKNLPLILEDEVIKQKAIFFKGKPHEGYIKSDKRVVTGQGVNSTTPLAKEVLELLYG